MLPRVSRVNSRSEINEIYKKGKKYSTEQLFIWVVRRSRGPFRALVVCSKKVDKRSSARNRMKRQIRELLRKDIQPIAPHVSIVVAIRPDSSKKLLIDKIKQKLSNVVSI